ncbi:hypothetical protein ACIQTZ_21745 [Paenarthrobacter sp. NPDC090520]|uniref:hypothetical protein n=1 Tax=Paenarthrobacter sp. NPDC090520 TaxID=3364382 RepID=UPI0038242FB2
MSDVVRQAPDDLFTIDVPGTYIAMGSCDMQGTVANTKYRNHPFAGGMVRIICSEFNGHLAMEAIRLDEAVAPFTSIKFVTDANWQAWTKRSRA